MQRNNYQESKKGQTQPERQMVFVNCIYNILGKKYMQPLTVASRMKLQFLFRSNSPLFRPAAALNLEPETSEP